MTTPVGRLVWEDMDPVLDLLEDWKRRNRWDFARMFCALCVLHVLRSREVIHHSVQWNRLKEMAEELKVLAKEPPTTHAHRLLFREWSNFAFDLAHHPAAQSLHHAARVVVASMNLDPFQAAKEVRIRLGERAQDHGRLNEWMAKMQGEAEVECYE